MRNTVRIFLAAVAALALFAPASVHAAKRVALVIGNGDYASSPLRNPVNDARDVAAALKKLGFTTILETNADKRDMVEAVADFGRKAQDAEAALFFYAGHGMQVNGINYLIPVDVDVHTEDDVEFEAMQADRVLTKLKRAKAKVNLVILDACRDNPFRSFRSSQRGLAVVRAVSGSVIVYATAPGDIAADGSGRNSPFTRHLLQNIHTPGLPVDDLFRKVGGGVSQETGGRQQPWISSSLYGEYYLAGGSFIDQVESSSPTGAVMVEVEPEGAEVFLDGSRIGRSPKTVGNLAPGRVRVRVSRDGYEPQERLVTIKAGETTHAAFALAPAKAKTGRLYVKTDPDGATVRILNIGPRYEWGMELEPGRYHVNVSMSGYKPFDRWVYLEAGQDLDVAAKLERQTPASPNAGQTWTDPATGMEFVWVPGGSFQMGDTFGDGDSDEKPVHTVSVPGFWMGKYEVTQDQWREIMGGNPSHFKGGSNPVERVSWDDVQKFIRKLNARGAAKFRLPSEAEWEYACRSGGKDELFSGGSNVDRVAWYTKNSGSKTHQVGTKSPNGLGLYDMSGNVWEWVEDKYHGSYAGAPTDGSAWVSGGGARRVFRGGGWSYDPSYVRCALRSGCVPGFRYDFLGARLVRTN